MPYFKSHVILLLIIILILFIIIIISSSSSSISISIVIMNITIFINIMMFSTITIAILSLLPPVINYHHNNINNRQFLSSWLTTVVTWITYVVILFLQTTNAVVMPISATRTPPEVPLNFNGPPGSIKVNPDRHELSNQPPTGHNGPQLIIKSALVQTMAWRLLGDKPLSWANADAIYCRIYAALGGDE